MTASATSHARLATAIRPLSPAPFAAPWAWHRTSFDPCENTRSRSPRLVPRHGQGLGLPQFPHQESRGGRLLNRVLGRNTSRTQSTISSGTLHSGWVRQISPMRCRRDSLARALAMTAGRSTLAPSRVRENCCGQASPAARDWLRQLHGAREFTSTHLPPHEIIEMAAGP